MTTFRRYCKAILNVFFNKKILMMTISLMWYIFRVKSKFYYLNCKNCLKLQVFSVFWSKFQVFIQISQIPVFFSLKCQIPGSWQICYQHKIVFKFQKLNRKVLKCVLFKNNMLTILKREAKINQK